MKRAVASLPQPIAPRSVPRAEARPAPTAESKPTSYTVSVVDRSLTLLEVLAEHPNIGVTRMAQLTGNTKSLVFRLLFTLERRGYVRKDPVTRSYALGFRSLFLGELARRQTDLIRLAQPHLDALVTETRENIYLTVRDGLRGVCVAARQSPQPLRLYADVGRAVPLHVGGGPKLLLAFAPPEVVQAVLSGPLTAFTPTTDSNPQALQRSLEKIRKAGMHESRGDLDAGAFSYAAPVRDHSGQVAAALSIAGPYAHLTPAVAVRYRTLVREHATKLSRELGYGDDGH
ncbi:MAG: IclR family transcriptional regulator [Alphaproteobacteria bacterium]|nr:IclR family transcriptional regulator [Alphaproteobacteria bacterium]